MTSRAVVALGLALILAVTLAAQDRPSLTFRLVQGGYIVGIGVDWGLSYAAVTHFGFREMNPAAAWTLRNPTVGVASALAESAAFALITEFAWKRNRTAGWVIAIAALVVKGVVIAHNIRELSR